MFRSERRILIVEDDQAISRVLVRSLEREGFSVTAVFDGQSALAELPLTRFDYVVCDYQLPDMTGEVVCRHIRSCATNRHAAIALCTAKAYEIDVAGLVVELGLDNVFFKPFSLREITTSISDAAMQSITS